MIDADGSPIRVKELERVYGFDVSEAKRGRPQEPAQSENLSESIAKYFDTAVSEVLEKIPCDVPITVDSLNAAYDKFFAEFKAAHPGSRPRKNKNDYDSEANGLYMATANGSVPSRIAIRLGLVEECFIGGVGEHHAPWYKHDGYNHYEGLTPEQLLKWVVCHEIAHIKFPNGHRPRHFKLTMEYMERLFPGISRLKFTKVHKYF